MELFSYHNDETRKTTLLSRLEVLEEANSILHKHDMFEKDRRALVYYVFSNIIYDNYEDRLGIPLALAHIFGTVFHSLKPGDALTCPKEIFSTIKVGSILEPTIWKLMLWLLNSRTMCQQSQSKRLKDITEQTTILLLTLQAGKRCDREAAWKLGDTNTGISEELITEKIAGNDRAKPCPENVIKATATTLYHVSRYVACTEMYRDKPNEKDAKDSAAFHATQAINSAIFDKLLQKCMENNESITGNSAIAMTVKEWLVKDIIQA